MINSFPEEIINFASLSAESLEDSLVKYQTHKRIDNVDEVRDISHRILFDILKPHYKGLNIEPSVATFNFMVEPLKNSFFHSDGNEDINLSLIASPSAFVFGISDGGSYFKRPEIKQCWEARKKYPEKNKSHHKEIGFGVGTGLIYDFADLIYVENSSGTLYVGSKVPGKLFRVNN